MASVDEQVIAHERAIARAQEWPSADLGELLDDVAAFLRTYVVMTDEAAHALALFVAHTWSFDSAAATPYIAVTSAEKRSGKTLVLDMFELLVAKPWRLIIPTEAVLYRKIAAERPTLLLDEYDAIFHLKREAATEPIRAIINAGYREGATVPRCVGQGTRQEVVDFPVFCPKVLAGIGDPPETIRDRCIVIRLERKARDENVRRFRRRDAQTEAARIVARLETILGPHVAALGDARPTVPDELDDRAAEVWEPLLAIAELAGEAWGELGRRSALALSGSEEREEESRGIQLLRDIRRAFDARGTGRLSTAQLIVELADDKEAPWGDWYGKPISPRSLANILKPYKIKSQTVRPGDGSTARGYKREQFEDAWRRYVSDVSASHPTHESADHSQQRNVTTQPLFVSDEQEPVNPRESADVSDVSDGGGVGRKKEKGGYAPSTGNPTAIRHTPTDDQELEPCP